MRRSHLLLFDPKIDIGAPPAKKTANLDGLRKASPIPQVVNAFGGNLKNLGKILNREQFFHEKPPSPQVIRKFVPEHLPDTLDALLAEGIGDKSFVEGRDDLVDIEVPGPEAFRRLFNEHGVITIGFKSIGGGVIHE